jgi:hypothetical protein
VYQPPPTHAAAQVAAARVASRDPHGVAALPQAARLEAGEEGRLGGAGGPLA